MKTPARINAKTAMEEADRDTPSRRPASFPVYRSDATYLTPTRQGTRNARAPDIYSFDLIPAEEYRHNGKMLRVAGSDTPYAVIQGGASCRLYRPMKSCSVRKANKPALYVPGLPCYVTAFNAIRMAAAGRNGLSFHTPPPQEDV